MLEMSWIFATKYARIVQMLRSILFLITLLNLTTVVAANWKGFTELYQISAVSDNRRDHQFKVEENSSVTKIKADSSCQFSLFFCGMHERFQDIGKICKAAWKNYKPVDAVEFGGHTAPIQNKVHEDGHTISSLIFKDAIEYGSLKSLKYELVFDKKGQLVGRKSKIFYRQLLNSKLVDDDSSYKNLDFGLNAAYFQIAAKCPEIEKK
jgi:hypothetical protein